MMRCHQLSFFFNKKNMLARYLLIIVFLFFGQELFAQKNLISSAKGKFGDGPDAVAPVGIIKGLSDDQLLDVVQKQTFRFNRIMMKISMSG